MTYNFLGGGPDYVKYETETGMNYGLKALNQQAGLLLKVQTAQNAVINLTTPPASPVLAPFPSNGQVFGQSPFMFSRSAQLEIQHIGIGTDGSAAADHQYVIEFKKASDNFWAIGNGFVTSATTLIHSLEPATSYNFRCRTLRSGVTSTYSNTLTATTLPAAPAAAPTGLAATATNRAVTLTWTPLAGITQANGGAYSLRFRVVGTTPWFSAVTNQAFSAVPNGTLSSPTVTSFNNNFFVNGSLYEVQLAAMNYDGMGPYSSTVTVDVPTLTFSQSSGATAPLNAWDLNPATKWTSGALYNTTGGAYTGTTSTPVVSGGTPALGEWVQIDYRSATSRSRWQVTSAATTFATTRPAGMVLLGKNGADAAWTVLDLAANAGLSNTAVSTSDRTFGAAVFEMYRVVVLNLPGGATTAEIADVALLAT